MATHRRRIAALKALVSGSVLGGTPTEPTINGEFDQVVASGHVRILQRRYLLQVLHSTRALDSALRAFVAHHGIPSTGSSLGSYLHALQTHTHMGLGRLPAARRTHYQNNIVDVRNLFMHEAGTAPANDAALATLVSEMQACLAEVFAL
jgi:hypothetical protein